MPFLEQVEQHGALGILSSEFFRSPHPVPRSVTAISLNISAAARAMRTLPSDCLPDGLQAAVPNRKWTFLAGRLCAEWAIRRQRPESNPILIGRGTHGEPIWPPSCIGSVTHTNRAAHAAVAASFPSHLLGIGIDSERVVDKASFDAIMSVCFSVTERELILLQDAPKLAATIMFSAKESFYKAVFGTVKRFVEFNEATIESICWATHTVGINVVSEDLSIMRYPVQAHFSMADDEVHTSVTLYSEESQP